MALKQQSSASGESKRLPFFHSMRGTLLIWFLGLALIPMAVVGGISYKLAQKDLIAGVKNQLLAVNSLKANEISRRFNSWAVDVKDEASKSILAADLGDLSAGFNYLRAKQVRSLYLGKPDLKDADDGSAYSAVHRERQNFFSNFLAVNGFEDAFLISPQGNVVYSARKTDLFGTNLASGPYKDTNLGILYRELKAAIPGEVRIADMALFNKTVALFMGAPVYQEDTLMGLLILQLPLQKINAIMLEREGMGKTGESYLVGMDRRMRSESYLDPERRSVAASFTGDVRVNGVDTEAVRRALSGDSGVAILTDYRGKPVLSAYAPVRVLNLQWAVISEMDVDEAQGPAFSLRNIVLLLLSATGVIVIVLALLATRRTVLPLRKLTAISREIAAGNLVFEDVKVPKNEIGLLKDSFKKAVKSLQDAEAEREQNTWFKSGQAALEKTLRGDKPLDDLCRGTVTFIAEYLNVQIGALFVDDGTGTLKLRASYAYQNRKGISNQFKMGEGLVGQAALEKQSIVVTDVPEDYIAVSSGLGKKSPRTILVVPLIYNDDAIGVLELGAFSEFTELQIALLEEAAKAMAIALNSARSRIELKRALERTQSQAEELQAQQEELKTANEELEEQTRKLQASEQELRTQQEELRVTNEELEEKTESLENQKKRVTRKNEELEDIQRDLEQKARELEVTSRYKSEFLANMSHELRTPLNSLLILSQNLAANKKKNLDSDQVEAAAIVHKSGQDLLNLINEILDLAKIEAGKMDIHMGEIVLSDLCEGILDRFQPMAEDKDLQLNITRAEGLPKVIVSDRQRLDQILGNLMSNAIKFTEKGKVTLHIHRPEPGVNLNRSEMASNSVLAISVMDTGIGIPEEKQLEIFEAFQQADGSTSRVYGGTGLGLSISRELARLLGGGIQLKSETGKGSTFTLYLPIQGVARKPKPEVSTHQEAAYSEIQRRTPVLKSLPSIPDDRNQIGEHDRTILVVEDDENFARTLHRFCHEHHFKCLHAADGETGLEMARTYLPDAVILDIRLPGLEGWGVLEALKADTRTRHIPVHMMSVEAESIDAYRKGAMGYLTKPATSEQLEHAFSRIEDVIERNIKSLLVVEDDAVLREDIIKLIGNGDVKTTAVSTGKEAIHELMEKDYDCMILDLKLPDISGFKILEDLDASEKTTIPPVIVYTGKDLTRDEEYRLHKYTASIIVKGVKSKERLLDETALFLHRVVDKLPEGKKKMIHDLHDGDSLFQGKHILVVDDDMRNVFAISRILEEKGMVVHRAPDGKKALQIMDQVPHMDMVLMDIMMPVMDGYEAMGQIRKQERFRNLPILAITAKAMQEDREKCIAAGANDYLPKPVDIERLLSLIRVWLYK